MIPSESNLPFGSQVETFQTETPENERVELYSDSIIGQFPAFISPSFATINASSLLGVEIVTGSSSQNEIISYITNRSTTTLTGQQITYGSEG